jgi:hypothetical protein
MHEQIRAFTTMVLKINTEELRDFARTSVEGLEKAHRERVQSITKLLEALQESGGTVEQSPEPELLALYDSHADRLTGACFLSSYSFLEDQMLGLAEFERQARNIALQPSDLRSKGIEAAKVYLRKVCGYELPNTAEWEEICRYRQIRNCIVHNNGRFAGDKQFRAYLESKRPAIKLDNDRIAVSAGFCIEAIDTIEAFVIQVIDSLV